MTKTAFDKVKAAVEARLPTGMTLKAWLETKASFFEFRIQTSGGNHMRIIVYCDPEELTGKPEHARGYVYDRLVVAAHELTQVINP